MLLTKRAGTAPHFSEMTNHCLQCNLSFKSPQAYKTHHERLHQAVVLLGVDGHTQEVRSAKDGSFQCRCGSRLSNARTFKKHVTQSCRLMQVQSVEVPTDDHPDLSSSEELDIHGLVINTRFMLLICRECGFAVNETNPISHMRLHEINMSNAENEACLTVINRLLDVTHGKKMFIIMRLAESIPFGSAALVEPVQGIPIQSGFRCLSCFDFCCTAKKSMKNHNSKMHNVFVYLVFNKRVLIYTRLAQCK